MMRPLAKRAKRLVSAMGLEYLVPKIDEVYTWWTIAEPEGEVDPIFWFAWADWAKEAGPWRWWFRNDLTQFISKFMVRPFVDAYWWMTYRFNPKYVRHVIRPEGLKPGLVPVSDRMLHAWMQIVEDYLKSVNFEPSECDDLEAFGEMVTLHKWWKTRPTREPVELPELPNGWTWDMTMDPAMQDTPFVMELNRASVILADFYRDSAQAEQDAIERLTKIRMRLIA